MASGTPTIPGMIEASLPGAVAKRGLRKSRLGLWTLFPGVGLQVWPPGP